MVRSAFGGHANQLGRRNHDVCCAPRCEEPSAIPSRELPLCEKHHRYAQRLLVEFAHTFRRNPEPTGEPALGLLGVPMVERISHVYYVRFGDRIKIGVTTNLPARLDALPWDEVLTVELGERELEQERHRQFRIFRVNGEWFAKTPELVEHIQSVVARENELGPGMRRFLSLQRTARAS